MVRLTSSLALVLVLLFGILIYNQLPTSSLDTSDSSIWSGLGVFGESLIVGFIDLNPEQSLSSYQLQLLVINNYTYPRILIALFTGMSLGLATVLIQQAIHNSLASDNTLGVSSGALFALILASVFAPGMLIYGKSIIALIGGATAFILVFLISWTKQSSSLKIILAGLIVSLYLGALSSALFLFYPEETRGVSSWLAGSLVQDGWQDAGALILQLLPALLLLFLFKTGLNYLSLDDTNAKSLGVPLGLLRFIALTLSIYLVAITISKTGLLGFIGLLSITIVRQLGIKDFKRQLYWVPVLGMLMLGVTDVGLQLYTQLTHTQIATGAVTSVVGTPVLIWLMFKYHSPATEVVVSEDKGIKSRNSSLFKLKSLTKNHLMFAGVVLVLLLLLSLTLAHGIALNWEFSISPELLHTRFPRILAALGTGVLMAIAGVILQRITYNPIASPELLGINAGVSAGIMVVIFATGFTSLVAYALFGMLGAILALAVVLLINYRSGFQPERIILTGISLTILYDAVQRVIQSTADFRIYVLLAWTNGSTYNTNLQTALIICGVAIGALVIGIYLCKWLDILSLQPTVASSLGLNLKYTWLGFFLLVAVICTASTLLIGPMSFIGLLAPHLARAFGYVRAKEQLVMSGIFGGMLMLISDFIGRQLIFPYELPVGLVATIIGATYFIFIMRKIS